MNKLYTKDNNPLFEKHQFIKYKPQNRRNKVDAKNIVKTLKEEGIQILPGEPLEDLPDKDAAIFCDLVYNPGLWAAIFKSFNINKTNINLKDAIANIKQENGGNLNKYFVKSKDADAFEYLSDLYNPILEKYKLVATSDSISSDDFIRSSVGIDFTAKYDLNFKSINYFGIAIAHFKDRKTQGIYIINRGTSADDEDGFLKKATFGIVGSGKDILADTTMALTKLKAGGYVIKHMLAGGFFAEFLLNRDVQGLDVMESDIKHIGFSGHSLGGSITQIQEVYFADVMQRNAVNLSRAITFQAFGVKNVVDGIIIESYGAWYAYTKGDVLSSVYKVDKSVDSFSLKDIPAGVYGIDFTGKGYCKEALQSRSALPTGNDGVVFFSEHTEVMQDLNKLRAENSSFENAEALVYRNGGVVAVIKVKEISSSNGRLREVRILSVSSDTTNPISTIPMPSKSNNEAQELLQENLFFEKMIKDIAKYINEFSEFLVADKDKSKFHERLEVNYKNYKTALNIKNYARQQDIVANIAEPVCGKTVIKVDGGFFRLKGRVAAHSMSNYRFQGYNGDNSLIVDKVDVDFSDAYYDTLAKPVGLLLNTASTIKGSAYDSTTSRDESVSAFRKACKNYKIVFSEMSNYKQTKFAIGDSKS
ncbi:hypothetical protein LO80_01875 [Candidatus Francisella endociliophora]|uniref:Uncharacterized protein n=1 Tax=Candidatus Francisella endociliophora TaxID=653937 RepID=A0A097EMQ2_9GAMM|nr:hypothetical protein [Francisella sp. FSC1006]AIT08847.1 hypothetical protein LO80_01875 [Francisella sp. FSC1006]